jgi:hypothetical protein
MGSPVLDVAQRSEQPTRLQPPEQVEPPVAEVSLRHEIRRALNIAEFLDGLSREERERFAWELERHRARVDETTDEPAAD